MKDFIIATILLCSVSIGSCMPTACDLACQKEEMTGRFFYPTCDALGLYCPYCRTHICPQYPSWVQRFFSAFISVGWNPFVSRTCSDFAPTIESTCTDGNHAGSVCELQCRKGYLPAPELYQSYGYNKTNYTHEQLMSFTTTCSFSNDGESVDWSSNDFHCVEKGEVLKKYFPKSELALITAPGYPYPDDFLLEAFGEELEKAESGSADDDDEEEGSGEKRHFGLFAMCKPSCQRKEGKYAKCTHPVQWCFWCRYYKICASSRSFMG